MSAPENIQNRLLAPGTTTEFTYPDIPPASRKHRTRDGTGIPPYLSDAYWWAYLARPAVWFFDHQPIINAILLGQYRRIMRTFIEFLDPAQAGVTLQLAAVYGELTPSLAQRLERGTFHLIDVAPVQLRKAAKKLMGQGTPVCLERMNSEALGYASDSFDTVLIYFLLHELPEIARARTLHEALRVLRPGGTLVIAETESLNVPTCCTGSRPCGQCSSMPSPTCTVSGPGPWTRASRLPRRAMAKRPCRRSTSTFSAVSMASRGTGLNKPEPDGWNLEAIQVSHGTYAAKPTGHGNTTTGRPAGDALPLAL